MHLYVCWDTSYAMTTGDKKKQKDEKLLTHCDSNTSLDESRTEKEGREREGREKEGREREKEEGRKRERSKKEHLLCHIMRKHCEGKIFWSLRQRVQCVFPCVEAYVKQCDCHESVETFLDMFFWYTRVSSGGWI
jgi:hypothetical protein